MLADSRDKLGKLTEHQTLGRCAPYPPAGAGAGAPNADPQLLTIPHAISAVLSCRTHEGNYRKSPTQPHAADLSNTGYGAARPAFVERSGKMMVPYLFDRNTKREMFESADIVEYLNPTYGA